MFVFFCSVTVILITLLDVRYLTNFTDVKCEHKEYENWTIVVILLQYYSGEALNDYK